MKSVADIKSLLTSCLYLEDQSVVVEDIQFYGSPWSPQFSKTAFQLERGKEMKRVWERIPDTTEFLITHSPPRGVRDRNIRGVKSGCEDLLKEVVTRVKPRYNMIKYVFMFNLLMIRYHVFGHIHEGYGAVTNRETIFVNASALNRRKKKVNSPVVIKAARKKQEIMAKSINIT